MMKRAWDKIGLTVLAGLSVAGMIMAFLLAEWFVFVLFAVLICSVVGVFVRETLKTLEKPPLTAIREIWKHRNLRFLRCKSSSHQRKIKWYFLETTQLIAVIVFLLALWSLLAFRLIQWSRDVTEQGIYTLSSRSGEIVSVIDEEITILLFGVRSQWNELDQLLRAYDRKSTHIKYRFVDMTTQQQLVREYDIKEEETLVFFLTAQPDNVIKVFAEDLRPLGTGGRQSRVSQTNAILTRIYDHEGAINQTLLTLLSKGESQYVYVLKTEANMRKWSRTDARGYSYLVNNLTRLGYEVAFISLETLLDAKTEEALLDLFRNGAEPSLEKLNSVFYLSEMDLLRLAPYQLEALVGDNSVVARYLTLGGGLVIGAGMNDAETALTQALSPSEGNNLNKNLAQKVNSIEKASVPQLSRVRQEKLKILYDQFNMHAPSGIVVDTENFHPALGQEIYASRGHLLTDFPYLTYHDDHPITKTLSREKITPFLLTPETLEPNKSSKPNESNTSNKKSLANLQEKITPQKPSPKNNPAAWTRQLLLKSGERAWLENDYFNEIRTAGHPRFHFGTDKEGEQYVAWTLSNAATMGRVVFIGDASFFENDLITLYGNRDFILNALLWSSGREELLGTGYQVRREALFIPTRTILQNFFLIFICGVPLVLLLGRFAILRVLNRH